MTKYKRISIIFGFLLFFGVSFSLYRLPRNIRQITNYPQDFNIAQTSPESTLQILNEIFINKADIYATEGYFPQIYSTSLQATFYGLSILNTLGKSDYVNETEVTNYIMSHYNSSSGIFMDVYASRYLGTDFNHSYYPLSTVLEVNCYALLSLSLLGELGLINTGKAINFLWSCYNPISSGFIGQPYHSGLDEGFKISTMDNTYFAIITLDLLMGGWTSYQTQQDELVSYINALQETNPVGWQYGGFYNDNMGSFNSLAYILEPNLLSSYYCLKSLEVFGMVSSINDAAFYQFLDAVYDPVHHYFQMSLNSLVNFSNLVATGIGLELSEIMNYPTINQSATISFLYTHRNEKGLWDASTAAYKYELIDTFQILRSIDNIEKTNTLNSDDTQHIVTSLFTLFSNSKGFSLISEEYTTMDLAYTMIKSFDLFNKISELNLPALYSAICNSYLPGDYSPYNGFISYLTENGYNSYTGFRSYPLTYYSAGDKNYIESISYIFSHKATFQALDALQSIHKLDDFALTQDLSLLLENIVDTQFLNELYPDQNGGFLPIMEYDPFWVEFLSKNIFLEYSFYAIKTLELLTDALHIGDLTFLNFDSGELINYIVNHITESSEMLYCQPSHTNDTDAILQNTYYMIYIFKALDSYTLNSQKIENFIIQHLDYTNIKNVYYSYKISELLDLTIGFNAELLQGLIINIYSDSLHEFYSTNSRNIINQEILLWICDVAINDPVEIAVHYNEQVLLGTYLNITASLSNLVLSEFEYNLSFQFECAQLGVYIMDKEDDNYFSLRLFVPQRSINYPTIEGRLVAYDTTWQLAEKSIVIHTAYNQKYYKDDMNAAVVLSVLFLGVPGGFILISGKKIRR